MTLLVVLLLDAGVLLIVSAVQDVTLIDVFRAVWTGQPLPKAATSSSGSGSGGSGTIVPPPGAAVQGPTGGVAKL